MWNATVNSDKGVSKGKSDVTAEKTELQIPSDG